MGAIWLVWHGNDVKLNQTETYQLSDNQRYETEVALESIKQLTDIFQTLDVATIDIPTKIGNGFFKPNISTDLGKLYFEAPRKNNRQIGIDIDVLNKLEMNLCVKNKIKNNLSKCHRGSPLNSSVFNYFENLGHYKFSKN